MKKNQTAKIMDKASPENMYGVFRDLIDNKNLLKLDIQSFKQDLANADYKDLYQISLFANPVKQKIEGDIKKVTQLSFDESLWQMPGSAQERNEKRMLNQIIALVDAEMSRREGFLPVAPMVSDTEEATEEVKLRARRIIASSSQQANSVNR